MTVFYLGDAQQTILTSWSIIYHHGPHVILGMGKEDYGLIDRVVCVSEFSRSQQLEYGIDRQKIRVIPNAIDTDIFRWNPRIQRCVNRYVFAGHINYHKGVHLLLEAFEHALIHTPDIYLDLYGENQAWSIADPGYDQLSKRNFLDSEGRIDWGQVTKCFPQIRYHGEISHQDLASEFQKSGFCVNGSWNPETFGLISLEAQACGCFPILPNFGGFPETLLWFCPRFFFEPRNSESLEKILTTAQKFGNSPISVFRRRLVAFFAREHAWPQRMGEIERLLPS